MGYDDRCNSSQGSCWGTQPNSDHRAHRSFNERRLRTLPAAGMDAFVTKPIRASELFEAIESTCSATLQVEPITIIKNGQLLWVVYFAIYAVPSAVLGSPRIASSSRLIGDIPL